MLNDIRALYELADDVLMDLAGALVTNLKT
jgi:hypothetical protein